MLEYTLRQGLHGLVPDQMLQKCSKGRVLSRTAGVAVVLKALCNGVKYGNRCAEENGREDEGDRDYDPHPQLLALRVGFMHKIPNVSAPLVHSNGAQCAGSTKQVAKCGRNNAAGQYAYNQKRDDDDEQHGHFREAMNCWRQRLLVALPG